MSTSRKWTKGQTEFNEVRYRDSGSPPRDLDNTITAGHIRISRRYFGADGVFEGEEDVEFWNLEALKLALLNPDLYSSYTKHKPDSMRNGGEGLFELGFLWEWPSERRQDTNRATRFGWRLIAACQRVYDKKGQVEC